MSARRSERGVPGPGRPGSVPTRDWRTPASSGAATSAPSTIVRIAYQSQNSALTRRMAVNHVGPRRRTAQTTATTTAIAVAVSGGPAVIEGRAHSVTYWVN